MPWLLVWWSAACVLTFCAFGADKARARRGGRRIAERTLFLLAALGGGCGAVLGMAVFRHKTKHWYFVWGMPAIALAEMGLMAWLWNLGLCL